MVGRREWFIFGHAVHSINCACLYVVMLFINVDYCQNINTFILHSYIEFILHSYIVFILLIYMTTSADVSADMSLYF